MKINIYLQFYKDIAGGYKVIYQYCNYLIEKDYDINIYYDLQEGKNKRHLPKKMMCILRKTILLNYPYYYKLNKKVKQFGITKIDEKHVRNADISIATSPSTAFSVSKLPKEKGNKFYFIQGYEDWHSTKEQLHKTYNLGMKNIVISKWLKEIVDKFSKEESIVVYNGIDLNKFYIQNDFKNRNKFSVSMIFHKAENKGCKYGIEALIDLKKEYPKLIVNLFGAPRRPNNLPEWFNYTQNATEEQVAEILNNSSIFICTSLFEGFGLPGLEAMACGTALVTTDCQGPLEYANDSNSIICKKGNKDSIYESIKYLFDNEEIKIKNINNGLKTALNWSIENAKKNFEINLKNS